MMCADRPAAWTGDTLMERVMLKEWGFAQTHDHHMTLILTLLNLN
jgi:hypothetical protein